MIATLISLGVFYVSKDVQHNVTDTRMAFFEKPTNNYKGIVHTIM